MVNIILCGGNGSRLWPLSRNFMPKQFLNLFDNKTLFQLTVERNSQICDKCIVNSNIDQYSIALDNLEELNNSKFNIENTLFLLEEVAKNTAPAIAFAALNSNPEDILFVTPSDHLIKNIKEYKDSVESAKKLAQNGYLVTFGIKPNYPHTGYGYIEANGEDVIKFHEKPSLEIAKKYIESKNFYWNSGIFMFRADVYLNELKKYNPKLFEDILQSFKKQQKVSSNQIRLKNMEKLEDISIDYAVMEKSDKIKMVKSTFDWSDVGSFDSISKEIKSNEAIEIQSSNNFYISNKTVAAIGVNDLIVVDTPDALLITKKGKSELVKNVVNKLKNKNKDITMFHKVVYRPWGTYEVLKSSKNYKIKKIIVKPGKRLSLQKHFHRSEHWVVVSGTATVTIGDKRFIVRPNESTYIKAGEVHRLENEGKIPVILIEVQVGEYTDEDDIIRIEDDYKRD